MAATESYRIKAIVLSNFRSFYGDGHRIELNGHNLLLHGANGSGKSSLAKAIMGVLAAANADWPSAPERNVFAKEGAAVQVSLELEAIAPQDLHRVDWNDEGVNYPQGHEEILQADLRDAAKATQLLDYRVLLKTYAVRFQQDGNVGVNLFDLLVNEILAQVPIPDSDSKLTFGAEWEQIDTLVKNYASLPQKTLDELAELDLHKDNPTDDGDIGDSDNEVMLDSEQSLLKEEEYNPSDEDEAGGQAIDVMNLSESEIWLQLLQRVESHYLESINSLVNTFHNDLNKILKRISADMGGFLQRLDPSITIKPVLGNLEFNGENRKLDGQYIRLDVQLHQEAIADYSDLLNEARLTAIALAMYLAAIKQIPQPKLKLLILDDVLIGLDMAHRVPALELLLEEFDDYQIVLLTYDATWYNAAKRKVQNLNWEVKKLSAQPIAAPQITISSDQGLLGQAGYYLGKGDVKAAAVYLRSALEVELMYFCEDMGVPVKFSLNDYPTIEDLLAGVMAWQKGKSTVIEPRFKEQLDLYKWLSLNGVVHAEGHRSVEAEIYEAMRLVDQLRSQLHAVVRKKKSKA